MNIPTFKEETQQHLNKILRKLVDSILYESSESRNDNSPKYGYSAESGLYVSEIIKAFPTLNSIGLLFAINKLIESESYFDLDRLIEKYKIIESNKNDGYFDYYVPLNVHFEKKITLNRVSIEKVEGSERKRAITFINSNTLFKDIDFNKYKIFKFQVKNSEHNKALNEFKATLSLFKGLNEYAYNKFFFNINLHTKDNKITGRKNQSIFKFPNFVHAEINGQPFGVIDNTMDMVLPDDYYDINEQPIINLENEMFIEETFNLLNSDALSKSLKKLMETSLRLYSLAIDTSHISESYLYFWNILEAITRTESGNTQIILNRAKHFTSKQFLEDNQLGFECLNKLRNDRVHNGTGVTSIFDLNVLKHIVDSGILFILKGYQSIIDVEHLDIFYSLHLHKLTEIKNVLDFKLSFNSIINPK